MPATQALSITETKMDYTEGPSGHHRKLFLTLFLGAGVHEEEFLIRGL